jgi:DNA polymerase-1
MATAVKDKEKKGKSAAVATASKRKDGKPDHVYLVDGSGYIFRAYHALPPMTRPDGTPVSAVYGFTQMLMRLLQDADCEYLAVIFDAAGETFRSEVYSEYKANREEPPDDLIPQFDLIRDAVRAFSLPCVDKEGFEADDIIATYAKQAVEEGKEVVIVSSDKDLMQLVGDHVCMLDPIKNKTIREAEVVERFGVKPDKVIDVQALMGDPTDNVPGIRGIGVKTAAELINEFGDLDALLARAGEIKQPKRREALLTGRDAALLSRQLVTLKNDVKLKEKIADFIKREPDHAKALAFLRDNSFKTLVARFEQSLAAKGVVAEAVAPEAAATTDQRQYAVIRDEAELKRWVDQAIRVGTIAIDTETTAADLARGRLVGISLSVEPGRGGYVPVGHTMRQAQGDLLDSGGGKLCPGQLPVDRVVAILKPMLEDRTVLKVGHDVKFDMQVFARLGVDVGPVDDTMLISYVLGGGKHSHELGFLAQMHLGHTGIGYNDVTGTGRDRLPYCEVDIERAAGYAAQNADITLALHRVLKPTLLAERLMTVYETLERPLVPVLAAMERIGIVVDRKVLEELSVDFAKRMAELEKEIHKLAGHPFSIGSPQQLAVVLFDELGLEASRQGKSGARSTEASVLEELALTHDLPARVLDWRQLQKLKSTYTDALVQQIEPETGRVHTVYAQAVASTGRLSSNDPNLQNIPVRTEEGRKIRRAFVAEKGWKLLSCDYSQIELRLLAHVADIPALKEAFRTGADIHAMTASEMFGIPVKGMPREVRDRAKAINFGIIYGISPFGLSRQLKIPQAEARKYIETYFQRYPGIRDYMEARKSEARKQGYVTTMFGRRCHTPGINDKNRSMASFSERAAINAPLQGAAADIIKRAMVRMPAALEAAGLKARMLLQVHDELVFEVPEKELDKTAQVAKKVMEGAAQLSVPLVVGTASAANWADAH